MSATGSNAQPAQTPPATVTVWAEGGGFWTGGGSANFASLPGLGAPYTSFNGQRGPEWAIGADYRPLGQPWHLSFDFRYGESGTTTNRASSNSSTTTNSFVPSGAFSPISSIVLGTTTVQTNNSSSATSFTERESHLVADLMIGRDLGVGANRPELQFGLRVADLHAGGQAQLINGTTTTTNTSTTFYDVTTFPGIGTTTTTATASSSSSSVASWSSRFFGVGPRVAVDGAVPIMGSWSFDYSGGVAVLIGDRSFDVAVSNSDGTGGAAHSGGTTAIFNADGYTAVSYRFTSNYKLSAGIRADFYNAALKTYDIDTGGMQNLSRVYWGPFLRLSGSF